MKISYETYEHLAAGGTNITAPTPKHHNLIQLIPPHRFAVFVGGRAPAMTPPAATGINALLCVIGLEKAICRIFGRIKKKNDLKYYKCCRNKQTAKHREATVANPVK